MLLVVLLIFLSLRFVYCLIRDIFINQQSILIRCYIFVGIIFRLFNLQSLCHCVQDWCHKLFKGRSHNLPTEISNFLAKKKKGHQLQLVMGGITPPTPINLSLIVSILHVQVL